MHAKSWILPLCVAIVSLANTSLAEPTPRETWHTMVDDEIRYGSRHAVVSRLDTGHWRYLVETRALIDLFGSQKQEVSSREEIIVTRDYRIVSIDIQRNGQSGSSTIKGLARGNELNLKFRRDGLIWKDSVSMIDDAIPSTCLYDFLHDQAARDEGVVAMINTKSRQ